MTKVFIGGSRRLSRLNNNIKNRINNIIKNKYTILIGDANGTDKSVQKYLFSKGFKNVLVFCMDGECRNNVGNWDTRNVITNNNKKDFNYYTAKDLQMAKETDYGFMIWDAKSPGTLNNIINLLKGNKKVLVDFSPDDKFYTLSNIDDLKNILKKCDPKALEVFEKKLNISKILAKEQQELNFA